MPIKKLLVISNMYPSETSKTFGIFVKNQVEVLRKKGLDVDVIAVDNPRMEKLQVIKKYLLWVMKTFVNFINQGKKYDVVHAHYVFPTGLIALLYKKIFKTRMVITAHGGDIDRMANKSPLIQKWTKTILHEADHVIAVGYELSRSIHENFGVKKENISVINMGVNRTIFTPIDKKEARKQCGIDETCLPILYVGNIIKQKGLLELTQAFEHVKVDFPTAKLYMIGAAKDPQFKRELEQFIADRQIKDVVLLDEKPQSEISVWMSAAELFVLPSHIEGFGLVALEAMSCHTPVVASKVGGLTYLLEAEAGILVEPENPKDLYNGMKSVLENPHLTTKLKEKGEKRAQQNDQDHLIEKVLQVYSPLGG